MNRSLTIIFFFLTFFFLWENGMGKSFIPPGDSIALEDSVIVKAGKGYKAGKVKSFFFGSHYRKVWDTPVKAPVFNIRKEGLSVVEEGGGRQTINLRLADSSGREYVLRSVDKIQYRSLPEEWHKTFIADIFQDQVTTAHPYGAFTIPPLADAAGVFHTTPRLVFVPHDSSFGKFSKSLGGKLALFEERPDGNMNDLAHMGNPPNVIGTEKMLEKRFENNCNTIDELLFARSRLFDMWIGDWSRHEDQWRWGVFPSGSGEIYKPIPRDRDHVYFKFDGLLPKLVGRSRGLRHLVDYKPMIKNLKGLNNSARNLDRIILSSLTREDWVSLGASLQASLTDEKIEAAIGTMPPEVYPISGPEIISLLKARRDELSEAANEYYSILARQVDVYGSKGNERFEINRLNDNETEVKVFRISSNQVHGLIYRRIFHRKETQEVRVYGLEGDDEFYVYGKAPKGILLRIIGGEGTDKLLDSSYVAEGGKKTKFYDTRKYNQVLFNKEAKDLRSDNVKDSVHRYPHNHNYDYTGPYIYPEYNVDDGLFIGAGFIKRDFGFRKSPYAKMHRVGINYATGTGAFNFRYIADYRNIFRNWHLEIEAGLLGPRYVINYFGFGNESEYVKLDDMDFYRVRLKEIILLPLLYHEITDFFRFGIGPIYQNAKVQNTHDRYINLVRTTDPEIEPDVFKLNHFGGIRFNTRISNVEDLVYPDKGIRWNMEVRGLQQLDGSKRFLQVCSDLSLYYTPKFLHEYITLATRLGVANNFGDFYFFQANTLGGTINLRGYRRTRFYGRTAAFQNIELRVKVLQLHTYLFPFKMGTLLFYDYGRVWADGEKSDLWHYGYGPGLWIEILNRYLFSGTYGFSEEENRVNVKFGFYF